jgi:hypothetical protein
MRIRETVALFEAAVTKISFVAATVALDPIISSSQVLGSNYITKKKAMPQRD